MKIALDAMGGDFAPRATIEGAVQAARDFNVEIILVGDRQVIEQELQRHKHTGLALSIEHAPEVVTMHDSPVESVLSKPRSSLHVGYDLVRRGDAIAFVSAGNSGAMLTTGIVILGNLPGVDRPAIATAIPSNHPDNLALIIDAGANTEVKPFNLVQFALMGSLYWRHMRGIEHPRVGILSNGEEESKGTDLTRIAASTLKAMTGVVNYIGYVEGRDINCGKVDVVVTDGFTGNVALKTMEGFARFMLGNLREIYSSGWRGRLSYLLVRKRFTAMRSLIDPSEYGGAPLLGINGIAIVSHGTSSPRAIRNAIRTAATEARSAQLNNDIVETLARIPVEMFGKSQGKGFRAIFARMRDRLHLHGRDSDAAHRNEADSAGKPERFGLKLESAQETAVTSFNGTPLAPDAGHNAAESHNEEEQAGTGDEPSSAEGYRSRKNEST